MDLAPVYHPAARYRSPAVSTIVTTQPRRALTLAWWPIFVALTVLSLLRWPLPLAIVGAAVVFGGLAALVDVAVPKHRLAELVRLAVVTMGIVVLAAYAMLASDRELSAPVQVAALVFAARLVVGSALSRAGGSAAAPE